MLVRAAMPPMGATYIAAELSFRYTQAMRETDGLPPAAHVAPREQAGAVGRHDVVIVGAGPAGSTAAALLAAHGHDVVAVDRAHFPRHKPCAEYMSPEIAAVLDRLGITDQAMALRHARLRGFRIMAPGGRSFLADFAGCGHLSPAGGHEFGLAQDRGAFDHLLVRHARTQGATVREGFTVQDVLPADERGLVGVRGRDNDGGPLELRCRVLIAADGLHSVVARRLDLMRPWRFGPRKIALVAHLADVGGLDDYGEMHVLPDGAYCGLAPLGGGVTNVAAVVDATEGQYIKGRREAYFMEHLARYPALRGRLVGAQITRPVLAIGPLAFRVRRRVAGQALLVGDATGFYDPFTGEGIYRAMRAAELAAEVIHAALAQPDQASLIRALATYEQRYRREFAGKRLVEIIVHAVISRPWLFDRVASRLAQRKTLADTLVGVTGDFVSPWAVLKPTYLARLLL